MPYFLMARAVFWLHFVISLWVFGGAAVEVFYPTYAKIHALFLASVLITQWLVGWRCPLTDLEKSLLRRGAPEEVYDDAYLRHYAQKYFGIRIPPQAIAKTLVGVLLWSLIVWLASSVLRN